MNFFSGENDKRAREEARRALVDPLMTVIDKAERWQLLGSGHCPSGVVEVHMLTRESTGTRVDWKLEPGNGRSQNHTHFGLTGLVMSKWRGALGGTGLEGKITILFCIDCVESTCEKCRGVVENQAAGIPIWSSEVKSGWGYKIWKQNFYAFYRQNFT